MTKENMKLIAVNVAVWGTLLIISLALSACADSFGWQFQAGFHPVTAINHTQQLGGVKSSGGAIMPAKNNREGY